MSIGFKFLGHAAAFSALAVLAAPAHAQFGSILRNVTRSATAPPPADDGCGEGRSRDSGSRVAGNVLGSIAGDAARRAGVGYYVPVAAFTDQITAAIACKLDPEEQKQAAEATLEATRGAGDDGSAEVGASSAWTSATRADVSGTSTVVARNDESGGLECITVSDVIIVSGEETRADKRMCRRPPAARYALAA